MSLGELLKAIVEAIADFAEIIEEVKEQKRAGGNPPPEVSVHDEMMRRWPTRQEARQMRAWPPFFGHRRGLGDRDAA
jgi:hypothetical protein